MHKHTRTPTKQKNKKVRLITDSAPKQNIRKVLLEQLMTYRSSINGTECN